MYLNAAFGTSDKFRSYLGYVKQSAIVTGSKALANSKEQGGAFVVGLGLGIGKRGHPFVLKWCSRLAWPTVIICFAVLYADGDSNHWWYIFFLGPTGFYVGASALALGFFKAACLVTRGLAICTRKITLSTSEIQKAMDEFLPKRPN